MTPAKPTAARKGPIDVGAALVRAYLTSERINQTLLELLDPTIWRLSPPCSKRRNIATSFAHIHNVRCMRLKMSGRGSKIPAGLDRADVTIEQAKSALAESATAMAALIRRSLDAGGRVQECPPDVVSMAMAAISHEAHHRGQICHWARELGSPITSEQQLKLWDWHKRWKETPAE